MKRLFFAAMLMLAISALVVTPTFAADECDHDMGTHEPTVAALIDHVKHANEMGHIENSLMQSLMAPLNTAANEDLPVAARTGALQAFINHVDAQAGKQVDPGCAEHLVMHAEHVIHALNGQM